MKIEFRGHSVAVNGVSYQISAKTALRFGRCTSQKEYAEGIEHFTYLVLVKKEIPNDGWFEKKPLQRIKTRRRYESAP